MFSCISCAYDEITQAMISSHIHCSFEQQHMNAEVEKETLYSMEKKTIA